MNKYLLLISLMFLSFLAHSQKEKILQYDVDIEVKQDRWTEITEYIKVYASGQNIKRGITRSFPLTRKKANGGKQKLKYEIVSIKKDGRKESFFSQSQNGNQIVYIGSRDVFLQPGVYDYTVTYRVQNQIGFFDNYDEIYWNAIGTENQFEVDKSTVRVILPENAQIVQESAYTGVQDEIGKNYSISKGSNMVEYTLTKSLEPSEGFTVAVGFNKGVVEPPSFVLENGARGIFATSVLGMLTFFLYTWYVMGRDPKIESIAQQFDVPDNLSPGSVSYLYENGPRTKAITASLMDLIRKGFIKIETLNNNRLFNKPNYRLSRLNGPNMSLPTEQKVFLEKLFAGGNDVYVDGGYDPRIEITNRAFFEDLKTQYNSFLKEGNNTKMIWYGLFLILVTTLGMIIYVTTSYYNGGIGFTAILLYFIFAIIGLIIYGRLIKSPTREKLILKAKLKSLKSYFQSPTIINDSEVAKTDDHFENLLPYALALGVDGQWSKRFEDLYKSSAKNDMMRFYYDYNHLYFTRSFASSAVKPPPPPSSSGGGFSGGSGGGGFSGGGGGGGGVGGW